MINIKLELREHELATLKMLCNLHQNIETMEILKQIEGQQGEVTNG